MNIIELAASHPKGALALGIVTVVSVAGTGIAFACNKTPVIGTLSPTFNFNVGLGKSKAETKASLPPASKQPPALNAGRQPERKP